MEKIKLGDIVKDMVTGYTGKVREITQWINECRRITVQRIDIDKDGNPYDMLTFDEPKVEIVEKKPAAKAESGGPQNEAAALKR